MASNKRSARAKQTAAFKEQLGNLQMGDIFQREEQRIRDQHAAHDAALRNKACESKNRYMSRYDAELAISSCADHGTTGLHCYKCSYCNGWHLTSKPPRPTQAEDRRK